MLEQAAIEAGQAPAESAAKPPAAPVLSPAAQRVREAVAARYRQSTSYREFFAAEAGQASQQAAPEVETAPAAASKLDAGRTPAPTELPQPQAEARPIPAAVTAQMAAEGDAAAESALYVRHFEGLRNDALRGEPRSVEPRWEEPAPGWVEAAVQASHAQEAEELLDLNEEIEFRLAPEFDPITEPLPMQANVIEFPRQLVAAKKARPRLAEGPLRTEESAEPQLRIFEVEPESFVEDETEFDYAAVGLAEQEMHAAPEWQSLVLDAPQAAEAVPVTGRPDAEPAAAFEAGAKMELRVASVELRLLSASVDAICVGASFLMFVTVAVLASGHALRGTPPAAMGAAAGALLLVLFVLYQALFFSFVASTPGMYYANLVFRSMQNEEPSRGALQRRILGNLLAAAPAGLGLLWSVFDHDNLGWNDRISGTYLREF